MPQVRGCQMLEPINDKVDLWSRGDISEPPIGFENISSFIDFLATYLFYYYEPANNPNHPEFYDRLNAWLNNTDNEEYQKTLFRLVPHLFYIGRDEFDSLYRTAFNFNFAKWLIDVENIQLDDDEAHNKLQDAIKVTWFCPITDSMRINAFYHINQIHNGFDYRPDWCSLYKFGSDKKIIEYINEIGIKYLVLVEDFVGSGSQIEEAVRFAASLENNIPILLMPLITCPKGKNTLDILAQLPNVSSSPVICIPDDTFITDVPVNEERDLFSYVRDMIIDLHFQVCGYTAWPHPKPYSPFGYCDTGGLVVMYSNCPDNSLPIIHHNHDTWKPLFPRLTRV